MKKSGALGSDQETGDARCSAGTIEANPDRELRPEVLGLHYISDIEARSPRPAAADRFLCIIDTHTTIVCKSE